MIGRALLTTAPLQIVQAVLGFATIWAFTRLMTPGEYGTYALLLSFSMLAHTLAFTWAESAAFRFLPQESVARANHFATLKRVALGASVLVLLLVAAAPYISSAGVAAGLAAAAAFYRFVGRLMRETERAEQRMRAFVAAEIAYVAGGFAIGAVLLATTSLGPAAPFAGLFAVSSLLAARDAPALLRLARGGTPDHALLWRYARYGFPLALALALDVGVQACVRAILAITQGASEVGAYAAAFGLARPIDLICAWLGLSAAPALLSAWRKSAADTALVARGAGFVLLAMAAPASVGLALVSQPLAQIMVGAGLASGASAALPWLALAALTNGAALHFWSEAFQLSERTALRMALIGGAAIVQVVLTLVLAPKFGATGAAMAAAAGAIVGAVLLGCVGTRLAPLALAGSDIARIGVATMTMALIVPSVPEFGGVSELAAKAGVGLAAYSLAIFAVGGPQIRERASVILQRLRVSIPALRT